SMDKVSVRISRPPFDVNLADSAGIGQRMVEIDIVTEEAARLVDCGLVIEFPDGATDGTLSTEQEFKIRADVTPSLNADSVWVELSVPFGSDTVGVFGTGDGSVKSVSWIFAAPAFAVESDTVRASFGGIDINSGYSIPAPTVKLPVEVEERAELALEADISGPEEALDYILSVNLPFEVTAVVSRSGDASVDTTGARLKIELPDGLGYTLEGVEETFKKPFYPGEPVVWRLRAPDLPVPAANLVVRFVEPYAEDVNTNAAARILNTEKIIPPIITSEGMVTMDNISREGIIPPFVVPPGTPDVPVLRVIFRNNSSDTVGLDTLYVGVKNDAGVPLMDQSRWVSTIGLFAAGFEYPVVVGEDNPVPLVVGHDYKIEPGGIDTVLLEMDIVVRAPSGGLRIDLARSSDVVFTVQQGTRLGVSWEGDGGDIGGHFFSGPLQIMSAPHNYPNPFRAGSESTKIIFWNTKDAVSIRIYDLAGRSVWSKDLRGGESGMADTGSKNRWEVEWDGYNDRGRLVRNGVYICRIEAGSQSVTFKIAVAK
ncbi:MAG: T9SS type A sorting domain-containing protein, partial [Candidatus Krumholzibacteria bacterium]|nr:T9SS type A sorting domain-containing protein [Candidatus Krumholzibacteria bacterium]